MFAARLNHYALALLRRMPRPALRRIRGFPPLDCRGESPVLAVLTTPRDWLEALWCAYGWRRFFPDALAVRFFLDGEVDSRHTADVAHLFPGARIEQPRPLDASLGSPALEAIFRHHRFGRKLHALLALNQRSPILYSDFDVLCFREPEELLASVKQDGPPRFMREQSYEHTDPWMAARAAAAGIALPAHFNAGMLYLPRGALSLALARELVTGWTPAVDHLLTEQTLMAALVGASDGHELPPERYVTSWDGMTVWQRDHTEISDVVMRHYCGVVRHRFYEQGLPWLEKRIHTASRSATTPAPAAEST
ncbi:MAG TPA: hypothetical protein VHD62_15760 [Opitutaceae bacterium]|nr:hypothetical protein [Opitutaceae bacterium]